MEEKKGSNNGLLIFILILAIIVICVMGYLIYKLNNDKITATEQIGKLENQINDLEESLKTPQEESNNTSDTESKIKNTSNTSFRTDNLTRLTVIEDLLKNKGEYEYLKIKNIKEDKDKYVVKADFYVPTPITEKEYSEMVNSEKIILKNKEYIFEDSDDAYNPGYGYIYLDGQEPESGYWIEKIDEGYIFIHEIGGVYDIINEVENEYSFYLGKYTEVSEVAEDGDKEELEEFLSKKENQNMNDFFAQVVYSAFDDNDDDELRVLVDKR